MGTQLCHCDARAMAMSLLHDMSSIGTFLASDPLLLAYLLFFSPRIFSFLAFFYPLLASTSLLLLLLPTIAPYLGHSPQSPPEFLGRTCGIALGALCAEPPPGGAPDIEAVLGLREIMGELYCSSGSCLVLDVLEEMKDVIEEEVVVCQDHKEFEEFQCLNQNSPNATFAIGDFRTVSHFPIPKCSQELEVQIREGAEETQDPTENFDEFRHIERDCQDMEAQECKGTQETLQCDALKEFHDCEQFETSTSMEQCVQEPLDGNAGANSPQQLVTSPEFHQCGQFGTSPSMAQCMQESVVDNAMENSPQQFVTSPEFQPCGQFETTPSMAQWVQESLVGNAMANSPQQLVASPELQQCGLFGTTPSMAQCMQESLVDNGMANSPQQLAASPEFQQCGQFGTSPFIAQTAQEPLVGNAMLNSPQQLVTSPEFHQCWQFEESSPMAQCAQASLVGSAGANSPDSTSIASRVHSRSTSECVLREASVPKEKEWKRTLACKLYEERMHLRLCEHRAAAEGSEQMDMLWEAYEVNGSHDKDIESNDKAKDMNKQEEEGEDEGPVKLCCLQALKLSTSKMNLGVGKPNLVKFSKVLRRINVFSGGGSRRNQKG